MTDAAYLADKVAVVTGGASGIGAATTEMLRRRGAAVSVWDIAPTTDDGSAYYRCIDVRDPDAVSRAAQFVECELGGIDLLINVAGGGTQQMIESMSPQDWNAIIALNLSGPFYAIKACVAAMRRRGGGRIVIVSSLAALRMSMNLGVSYTAAKSGLLGLTRHAAFEYARDNILVNAVLPGPVMTPLMREKSTPEAVEYAAKSMPLGRFLTPDEIAEPILFFCSPASSGCTGATLLIDGGCSIGVVPPETYFRGRS